MAFKCNYSKYGLTFSEAYVKIESLQFASVKHQYMDYGPEITTMYESGSEVVTPSSGSLITETSKRADVIAKVWATQEARDAYADPISSESTRVTVSFEAGSGDLLQQAYEALKALPEFQEPIVDVL